MVSAREKFYFIFIKFRFFRYVAGIVFGAEHFLIFTIGVVHFLISDTPKHVWVELARRDYMKDRYMKKLMGKADNLKKEDDNVKNGTEQVSENADFSPKLVAV